MKKIDYKLIDTAGQITAVVTSEIKRSQQTKTTKNIMSNNTAIEQVAFLEKRKDGEYRLQMMGNELSINGTLAGIFLISKLKALKKVNLVTSGMNSQILGIANIETVSAKFPRNVVVKINRNIIVLKGIVYAMKEDKVKKEKLYLQRLSNKFNVPASGIIYFQREMINPMIFVKSTNTLVRERACGSGSLAYYLFSGFSKIEQPSGLAITIDANNKFFTIKTNAKIVK